MFRSRKYKVVRWFFGRPILPFVVQLIVLAPLILAGNQAAVAGAYMFASPWLLPVLGILNLPFVAGLFRAFRMDTATRRNHALEHATIIYLEEATGRRFSGRAARNGFRVSGRASIEEISAAFDRVRRVIRAGGELSYVSSRCGSNIVTALGLAIGMLCFVAFGSVVLRPSLPIRVGALTTVVLAFVGLRRGFGNAIQRRCFMAVDFSEVSSRDVRRVALLPLERGAAYFVETIVRPKGERRSPAARGHSVALSGR